MDAAIELAGFFAAHAVWSVCEGETLIPILAFQLPDGKQAFRRVEGDQLEDAVASGKDWLKDNPKQVSFAVLIYDAFVTLPAGRTDALLIEVHAYGPPGSRIEMAVPYRHADSTRGFAVHKPKFLAADGFDADFVRLGEAFFLGVSQHEKGAEVWNTRLDEAV
jgi:hypothetical protein